MMKYLIIMLAVVALSGCHKDNASLEMAIPPGDVLSDASREELNLPANSDLTLAKDVDFQYVKTLDAAVETTVADFLKPTGRTFQINAARPVGKYLLLWVSFPKIADGGVDLIYSVEKKKIVGKFLGGTRG